MKENQKSKHALAWELLGALRMKVASSKFNQPQNDMKFVMSPLAYAKVKDALQRCEEMPMLCDCGCGTPTTSEVRFRPEWSEDFRLVRLIACDVEVCDEFKNDQMHLIWKSKVLDAETIQELIGIDRSLDAELSKEDLKIKLHKLGISMN